jgi:hypothetical protein
MIAFLAVIVLVIGVAFVAQREAAPSAPPLGTGNERAWVEYIKAVGPETAYAALSERIANEPVPQQHTHAHFFGAALFDAVGVSGLPTCDSRYSFGCFHEFLGHAIRDLGLDVVGELNRGCHEALPHTFLSCQHGIGHGVYAYFGYDSEESLFKSLEVCRSLPDADVIGGCYGGVFMEYNLRTMWGVSAQMREPTEDIQNPCSAVDERFVPACVYWQPQWWVSVVRRETQGVDTKDVMRQIGGYCVASRNRKDCYEGIGNIILSESRDQRGQPSAQLARNLCSAAARNPADELRCLSVAANHFGIDVSKESALDVCSDLSGESRDYCAQHADNTANIAQRIPFPAL